MFTYLKAAHCCGTAKQTSNSNLVIGNELILDSLDENCKEDCLMNYTAWHGLNEIHHMKTGEEIEIVRIIRHPDYDPTTLKNDICLIKEKFTFNLKGLGEI